jgi:hypothetical protein
MNKSAVMLKIIIFNPDEQEACKHQRRTKQQSFGRTAAQSLAKG